MVERALAARLQVEEKRRRRRRRKRCLESGAIGERELGCFPSISVLCLLVVEGISFVCEAWRLSPGSMRKAWFYRA